MTRGLFIVLEGIDGSGTTSQARHLARYLAAERGSTTIEAEPWPDGMEVAIRDHIERKTPAAELAVLFTADRIRHCREVIAPTRDKGEHVVCDRYRMSTMVYQGVDLPAYATRFIRALTKLPTLEEPDLTILLDVDPQVAYTRLGKTKDRYERDRPFQERTRMAYLDEAHRTANCVVIPTARLGEQAVAKLIRAELWRLPT